MAVVVYQLCFFTGTTRTGVALATVIALGSAPMFSGLLRWAIDRQAPTSRWAGSTLVATFGIAPIARGQSGLRTDRVGMAASLLAGFAWAVYALIAGQRIRNGLNSTLCMAAMFAMAGLLAAPLLGLSDTAWIWTGRGLGLSAYLGVVTVGVV